MKNGPSVEVEATLLKIHKEENCSTLNRKAEVARTVLKAHHENGTNVDEEHSKGSIDKCPCAVHLLCSFIRCSKCNQRWHTECVEISESDARKYEKFQVAFSCFLCQFNRLSQVKNIKNRILHNNDKEKGHIMGKTDFTDADTQNVNNNSAKKSLDKMVETTELGLAESIVLPWTDNRVSKGRRDTIASVNGLGGTGINGTSRQMSNLFLNVLNNSKKLKTKVRRKLPDIPVAALIKAVPDVEKTINKSNSDVQNTIQDIVPDIHKPNSDVENTIQDIVPDINQLNPDVENKIQDTVSDIHKSNSGVKNDEKDISSNDKTKDNITEPFCKDKVRVNNKGPPIKDNHRGSNRSKLCLGDLAVPNGLLRQRSNLLFSTTTRTFSTVPKEEDSSSILQVINKHVKDIRLNFACRLGKGGVDVAMNAKEDKESYLEYLPHHGLPDERLARRR